MRSSVNVCHEETVSRCDKRVVFGGEATIKRKEAEHGENSCQ